MLTKKLRDELRKEFDLDDKQLSKFYANCELGDAEIEYNGDEVVEIFIRLRLLK